MRFLPFIQKFSSAYIDEIFGLAEGARLPISQALLCQVRAEASRAWDGGCTAFALTGEATAGGITLAGQNQDLESEYEDVAIILRVRPTDGRPSAVMFTFAGQLGYAGMNQYGVSNFVNALYNYRWRPGLSYYPIRRVLLEQRTVDDCVRLLRAHRACSAANLVLADRHGRIADVECRPEGVELYPDSNPAVGCIRITTSRKVSSIRGRHAPRLSTSPATRAGACPQTLGPDHRRHHEEILADHEGEAAEYLPSWCSEHALDLGLYCGALQRRIARPARTWMRRPLDFVPRLVTYNCASPNHWRSNARSRRIALVRFLGES